MDSEGFVGLILVLSESRLAPRLPNFPVEKQTLGRRKIRKISMMSPLSIFYILLSLPFSEEVTKYAVRTSVFSCQAFHNKFHSLIFWPALIKTRQDRLHDQKRYSLNLRLYLKGSYVQTNTEMSCKFIRAPCLPSWMKLNEPRKENLMVSQVQEVSLSSKLFDDYVHTNTPFWDHKTSSVGKTQNAPLLSSIISKRQLSATWKCMSCWRSSTLGGKGRSAGLSNVFLGLLTFRRPSRRKELASPGCKASLLFTHAVARSQF